MLNADDNMLTHNLIAQQSHTPTCQMPPLLIDTCPHSKATCIGVRIAHKTHTISKPAVQRLLLTTPNPCSSEALLEHV